MAIEERFCIICSIKYLVDTYSICSLWHTRTDGVVLRSEFFDWSFCAHASWTQAPALVSSERLGGPALGQLFGRRGGGVAQLRGPGGDVKSGLHHWLVPAQCHHPAPRDPDGQVWASPYSPCGQVTVGVVTAVSPMFWNVVSGVDVSSYRVVVQRRVNIQTLIIWMQTVKMVLIMIEAVAKRTRSPIAFLKWEEGLCPLCGSMNVGVCLCWV